MFSFTPRPLYSWWRNLRYALSWLCGSHSRSGCFGEEEGLLPLPRIDPRTFKSVDWLLYRLSYHHYHYHYHYHHRQEEEWRRRTTIYDFWCLYPPLPRHVKFEVLMAVSTKSRSSGMWRRVVSCRYGNVKSDRFCYVKWSVVRTGGDFEIPYVEGLWRAWGRLEWPARHDKCLSVSTDRPSQPALVSVTLYDPPT